MADAEDDKGVAAPCTLAAGFGFRVLGCRGLGAQDLAFGRSMLGLILKFRVQVSK